MVNINNKLSSAVFLFFLTFSFIISAQAFPGELDTSFIPNGYALYDFPSSNFDYGNAVAINQTSNKIIVAGTANCVSPAVSCFAVVVYESNGSLDTTFNSSGRIRTLINNAAVATAVAIDSSDPTDPATGKILVAGYTLASSGNYNFAVARYNTNGSLDTTFDSDGIQTEGFGSSYSSYARAVAVQSDGKIIVSGQLQQPNGQVSFAVVRYNVNGTLDASFNGNGKSITETFAANFMVGAPTTSMVLSTDKILVAGNTNNGYAIVRYNMLNGLPDTSFGSGGTVVYNLGNPVYNPVTPHPQLIVHSITLQSGGKIVGTGSYSDLLAVFRLNDSGTLDKSFGNAGYSFVAVPNSYSASGNGVLMSKGGNIMVAGTSINSAGASTFTTACFDLTGKLNPQFDQDGVASSDDDGIVRTMFNTNPVNVGNGIALHPNGKIVVAGSSSTGSTDSNFAVVRYRMLKDSINPL